MRSEILDMRLNTSDCGLQTTDYRLLTFIFILFFSTASAQTERRPVRQGNELYKQGKFDEAMQKYDAALEKKPSLPEAIYNKGNVFFQKEEFDNAQKQFETAAMLSANPMDKAKAFHNMGNAYMYAGKLKESVQAYKNSLRHNPSDMETKYNLAYALQMLKKQQEEGGDDNQQQEDKQDQQDENKDQNNQGDKQEQDQQNKEQKQDEQQQDKGKDSEDGEQQKPQPKQAQLSKEDAAKLLEALQNEEQKVQEKLQKQKGEPVRVKIEKDW